MKRELNYRLSGNEGYNANSLILLVKNMLCSKPHCQKGFNVIIFSYKPCLCWVDLLEDYSRVDALGSWYKSVNFGAGKSPVATHWRDRIDCYQLHWPGYLTASGLVDPQQ